MPTLTATNSEMIRKTTNRNTGAFLETRRDSAGMYQCQLVNGAGEQVGPLVFALCHSDAMKAHEINLKRLVALSRDQESQQ